MLFARLCSVKIVGRRKALRQVPREIFAVFYALVKLIFTEEARRSRRRKYDRDLRSVPVNNQLTSNPNLVRRFKMREADKDSSEV